MFKDSLIRKIKKNIGDILNLKYFYILRVVEQKLEETSSKILKWALAALDAYLFNVFSFKNIAYNL